MAQFVSTIYKAAGKEISDADLLPFVNYAFQASDMPVTLARNGQNIVLGMRELDGLWRAFQLKGQDLVYTNLVAAVAIVLAVPGLSWTKRTRWIATLGMLLWFTHVLALYAGSCSAVGDYLNTMPESALAAHPEWLAVAASDATSTNTFIGMWRALGSPALVLMAATLLYPDHFWRDA